jgi:hypothetical protein
MSINASIISVSSSSSMMSAWSCGSLASHPTMYLCLLECRSRRKSLRSVRNWSLGLSVGSRIRWHSSGQF